jgi:cytosine/adenosine deaminase-related metal-dependent hydrolase
MDKITLIKGGAVVAWEEGAHRLLRDGVVVFRGEDILHVGTNWPGHPDQVVDATGMLVSPGFVSTHTHISNHAGDRLAVDAGRQDFLRTGFLNYAPRRVAGGPGFSAPADPEAAIRYGFASLIRNGITTAVQLDGGPFDDGETMTRVAGESGLRLHYSPYFNGGDYAFDADGTLIRLRDEAAALEGLAAAARFIERRDGAFGGRLRGMLVLDELYTATPTLLRRVKETARTLGVGITLHASEQVHEFHEILRNTGLTPVGYMQAHGFLGPEVILGHCLYVTGHRYAGRPGDEDLDILAASGATVAHAPIATARRGTVLESFQRYLDRGVALAMGTDSYPQDMIAEMRMASLFGKVTSGRADAASAREVFAAATVGGARALGRPDLGRLTAGAKADILLIDLDVADAADPFADLLGRGSGERVSTVIVGGRTLLEGRRLIPWDEQDVLRQMRAGVQQIWNNFSNYHWSGTGVDDVFPPSLAPWSSPSTP